VKWGCSLSIIAIAAIALSAEAQSSRSKLEGMWSDPPATAAGNFCFFSCTDAGLERLNKLLDDPANDARSVVQLIQEAKNYERDYFRVRLTPAALKPYPLDPLQDPGYVRCEPWGLARQMFAPHQLELREQGKDRIELRYGEWAARRTIYMDGRTIPANLKPSRMGYSVGRWEGETLVVETDGIAANIAEWPMTANAATQHSDHLRTVERFTRSADGKTLMLTATLEDPWSLTGPVVLKKIWSWAPDQKIAPYDSCERPVESRKGSKP
jgi:hypothetical protein